MTGFILASSINWVDFLNYPHVGNPLPGQYDGPPVVFVLLDFAFFLYLANRFIFRPLVRMAREENDRFRQSVEEALRQEKQAEQIDAECRILESTMDAKKNEIDERIRQKIEIEREQIFRKAAEYQAMRKNETLKQILVKREIMIRQIRDEILVEAVTAFRREMHETVTPHNHLPLFRKGLDSLFDGKEAHHES